MYKFVHIKSCNLRTQCEIPAHLEQTLNLVCTPCDYGKERLFNKSEVLSLESCNVKWLHASELFQLLYYISELKKWNN